MENDYYKVTEELIHTGLDAISKSIKERENKARVRESIFSDLQEAGITVRKRSDWKAKMPQEQMAKTGTIPQL